MSVHALRTTITFRTGRVISVDHSASPNILEGGRVLELRIGRVIAHSFVLDTVRNWTTEQTVDGQPVVPS